MYNISSTDDLNQVILLLEDELYGQEELLKDHLEIMYESFTPVNVVRDIFKEAVTSDEFRSNVLTAIMGISAGYLTKKLLFRKSNNPFKSLFGNILQYGLANLFIHPSRVLKSLLFPLHELFTKKDEQKSGNV
jgi:hypothetical protein